VAAGVAKELALAAGDALGELGLAAFWPRHAVVPTTAVIRMIAAPPTIVADRRFGPASIFLLALWRFRLSPMSFALLQIFVWTLSAGSMPFGVVGPGEDLQRRGTKEAVAPIGSRAEHHAHSCN
jgi:hypothetical protein